MCSLSRAGHTILAYRQRDSFLDIFKYTIVPRGQAAGALYLIKKHDVKMSSKKFIESQIMVLLAGRLAEEEFIGLQNTP